MHFAKSTPRGLKIEGHWHDDACCHRRRLCCREQCQGPREHYVHDYVARAAHICTQKRLHYTPLLIFCSGILRNPGILRSVFYYVYYVYRFIMYI